MKEEDFTRIRLLPFWCIVPMIFFGWKMSLPNRINRFFKKLGQVKESVTSGALCHARKKVKPELFKSMSKELLKIFYNKNSSEGIVKKWKGYYIWAVDGSYVNIPMTKETIEKYFIQGNNQITSGVVQGLCSCLYDVLNEVVINSELSGKRNERDFVLNNHINYYLDNVIVLYDRAYVSYLNIATHINRNKHFLIRAPISNSFREITEFVQSDKMDEIVTIKVPEGKRKLAKSQGLDEKVEVRLLKIILDDGVVEILITSLLDQNKYKLEEFKWLYNQRWGVETHFDRLKNILEIEKFSSTSVVGIEQDFYALMFLSNLESFLSKEAQKEVDDRNKYRKLKYNYKINKSVSYCALCNSIVEIFLYLDERLEEVLEDLIIMFKKSLIPERLGRKFERKEKTPSQRLRYYKYSKREWT